MPEVSSTAILSNPPSRYPRIAPATAQKPKLLDRLSEALRSRHYSRRTAFCHSFAIHILESDNCTRMVQELLAHHDVKTTMIYVHFLNRGLAGVRRPVDQL
jgi:site-specific recombinase XerD